MPSKTLAASADSPLAAKAAGLRYVTDAMPGIRRKKHGHDFAYVDPSGRAIKDRATLARIRTLAIPPAWADVWICPSPTGHMQATGRDARGRKQYRYHAKWREIRDRTKYDKLIEFGALLPKIRTRVAQDLAKKGMPREKVLAAVVRILDITHMRIGNEEYAKDNHSYGLTTMREKHVDIDGSTVRFRFTGKSGQKQYAEFNDPRIAKIIKRCEELPGQELFGYVDDNGDAVDITSDDVNAYLREIAGRDVTAKEFRTWGGTVHAALCLFRHGECATELQSKRVMTDAVKTVAGFLGNKPATCKKYYIDPRIFSAYQKRVLCACLAKDLTKKQKNSEKQLQPIERAVLKLLQRTFG